MLHRRHRIATRAARGTLAAASGRLATSGPAGEPQPVTDQTHDPEVPHHAHRPRDAGRRTSRHRPARRSPASAVPAACRPSSTATASTRPASRSMPTTSSSFAATAARTRWSTCRSTATKAEPGARLGGPGPPGQPPDPPRRPLPRPDDRGADGRRPARGDRRSRRPSSSRAARSSTRASPCASARCRITSRSRSSTRSSRSSTSTRPSTSATSTIPGDVTLLTDGDEIIAKVQAPRVEESRGSPGRGRRGRAGGRGGRRGRRGPKAPPASPTPTPGTRPRADRAARPVGLSFGAGVPSDIRASLTRWASRLDNASVESVATLEPRSGRSIRGDRKPRTGPEAV